MSRNVGKIIVLCHPPSAGLYSHCRSLRNFELQVRRLASYQVSRLKLSPFNFATLQLSTFQPSTLENLQNSLGTGGHTAATGIDLHCHPDCPCKCLERRFNDVVRVDPIELADVQRHLAMVHHRYKELPHQLGVESANTLGRNFQAVA